MLGTILKTLDAPPLIGFTATPYRTDSGSLVGAELFDQIVWRMDIVEAIDAGLLVPLRTRSPKTGRIGRCLLGSLVDYTCSSPHVVIRRWGRCGE